MALGDSFAHSGPYTSVFEKDGKIFGGNWCGYDFEINLIDGSVTPPATPTVQADQAGFGGKPDKYISVYLQILIAYEGISNGVKVMNRGIPGNWPEFQHFESGLKFAILTKREFPFSLNSKLTIRRRRLWGR